MGRLDDKVVVITGSASGIGREAALLFSDEGARLCIADVVQEQGEQTAAECRDAFFQKVDVSNAESVQGMYRATAERYGGIDVLYNNAGIMPAEDASILDTDPGAWQGVQDVNTKGVYLCCKYGIPHLLDRGGGSVINVASFVALMGAATSQISYTASKGAVLA
ncbi:MAG: SDR family NAD(P)-dependent oxidoreductase, partial [Gaiellales bacterium]